MYNVYIWKIRHSAFSNLSVWIFATVCSALHWSGIIVIFSLSISFIIAIIYEYNIFAQYYIVYQQINPQIHTEQPNAERVFVPFMFLPSILDTCTLHVLHFVGLQMTDGRVPRNWRDYGLNRCPVDFVARSTHLSQSRPPSPVGYLPLGIATRFAKLPQTCNTCRHVATIEFRFAVSMD